MLEFMIICKSEHSKDPWSPGVVELKMWKEMIIVHLIESVENVVQVMDKPRDKLT